MGKVRDYIRERILTIKVSHLYNTVGEDDILKRIGTSWTVAGKPITAQRYQQLANEADVFLNSQLWEYLKKDIQYRANEKMFIKSKSEMDLVAGKLWLYTLDTIETKLKNLNDRS